MQIRNVVSLSLVPAGQLFGLQLPALRGISDFIVIKGRIYLSAIEVSINSKFFVWMDTSNKEEKGTDSRSVIKREEGKELTISIDIRRVKIP